MYLCFIFKTTFIFFSRHEKICEHKIVNYLPEMVRLRKKLSLSESIIGNICINH